jgi:hypothetical protein
MSAIYQAASKCSAFHLLKRSPLLAVILLAVGQPIGKDGFVRPPVGLLLSAGESATIRAHKGVELPSRVGAGELMYDGYRLFTGGRPVQYLHLPNRRIYTYSPRPGQPTKPPQPVEKPAPDDFDVLFARSGIIPKRVNTTDNGEYTDPLVLPGYSTTVDSSARERVLRLLANPPVDPARRLLATVTAAALLEKTDRQQAIAAYRQVRRGY